MTDQTATASLTTVIIGVITRLRAIHTPAIAGTLAQRNAHPMVTGSYG